MKTLSPEQSGAFFAFRVVKSRGGYLSFDDYDGIMRTVRYFAPMSWMQGWGDMELHKSNNDKMCAFTACEMGLLEQTDTGYRVKEKEKV